MATGTRPVQSKRHRPFWLPASSYYFLVAGLAIATFFLVLGLFHEGDRDAEIVMAGLAGSAVLLGGVLMREVVLRNARNKLISKEDRLDMNVRHLRNHKAHNVAPGKITLEANAAALDAIKKKSDAANVLKGIAQGHKEVFELCTEYRRSVSSEIPRVHPNSPRLKALIRGSEFAAELHRYHLLKWTEIETKRFTGEAGNAKDPGEKLRLTRLAEDTVDFGLRYYPDDTKLQESALVLKGLEISVRVSDLAERADHEAKLGERNTAIELYREAVRILDQEGNSEMHADAVKTIEEAIAELRPDS